MPSPGQREETSFRVLSAYTGARTIQEALHDAPSCRVLWLEILLNDQLDLEPILAHPAGQHAYQMACRWYTTFRTLIDAAVPRRPLPADSGPIDQRQYRTFIEALHFASPDA